MTDIYSHMDDWTDKQITIFKEQGKDEQDKQIEIKSGVMRFLSENKNIVSEGDSWFDYWPGTDIIDCLRYYHGYYIKDYAQAGDTLENMIYGTEINDDFQRTTPSIEKVLRKIGQLKPKVFLFSGGGNDIAGDEFASFINHKNSGLPTLREDYIENMINVVFKKYFKDLIEKVASISPQTNVVTHGYGHTIPTGKGAGIRFIYYKGPWLRPALAMKGIFDPVEQREAVEKIINAYNEMLADLDRSNSKFHHVDLRDHLDPDNDWANELHLKNSAFARVSDLIHEKIEQI